MPVQKTESNKKIYFFQLNTVLSIQYLFQQSLHCIALFVYCCFNIYLCLYFSPTGLYTLRATKQSIWLLNLKKYNILTNK